MTLSSEILAESAEEIYQSLRSEGFNQQEVEGERDDFNFFPSNLGTRGSVGVFPDQGVVVKFEDPEGYTSQNPTEVRTWIESKIEGISEKFAPIHAYRNDDFGWLLMEQAETMDCEGKNPVQLPQDWSYAGEPPEYGVFNGNVKNIDYGIMGKDEYITSKDISESDLRKAYRNQFSTEGEAVILEEAESDGGFRRGF